LTKQGTPESHFRSVKTRPASIDSPFAVDPDQPVGIDANASKTRWFNPETGGTANASAVNTLAGSKGDVEIYDIRNAPFDNPELLFELPLDREGLVDPRVFDPQGAGNRFSSNNALQFQKVFSPSHRFCDREQIIENTLLRLRIDESGNPGIEAEEFSPNAGGFVNISLPQNGFEVIDWDIREINPVQVSGVAVFQNKFNTRALNWQLQRGVQKVIFSGAANFSSDLKNLLAPITSDIETDPLGSPGSSPQDIRRRSEVLTP
jgi:hypothetical protein